MHHQTAETYDSDLRLRAKEIYCQQRMARLTTIAKQLRVPKTTIQAWQEEDDWLAARSEFQKNRMDELLQDLGDPKNTAKDTLVLSQKIRYLIDKRLTEMDKERRTDVEQIAKCQRTMTELYHLEYKIFSDVGLTRSN